MTGSEGNPAPLLLLADRQELDLVALLLESPPAFAVVVAPPWLSAAAQSHLDHALGADLRAHKVRVDDPEAIPATLAELAQTTDVHLLCLPQDEQALGRVLASLNLHREKLRRPGARFVLWVEGQPAFRRMLRDAPDLYSFRSRVAILRGAREFSRWLPGEEGSELAFLRQRVVWADGRGDLLGAAKAREDLGRQLRSSGRLEEAQEVVTKALEQLDRLPDSPITRITRSKCHDVAACVAGDLDQAGAYEHGREALAAVEGLQGREALFARARALIIQQGALTAPSLTALRRSSAMFDELGDGEGWLQVQLALAQCLMMRGALAQAHAALEMSRQAKSIPFNEALQVSTDADLKSILGAFEAAAASFAQAEALLQSSGHRPVADLMRFRRGAILQRMGEFAAAEQLLREIDATSQDVGGASTLSALQHAAIAAAQARVEPAHEALQVAATLAEERHQPSLLLGAWSARAQLERDLVEAGLADPACLAVMDGNLAEAQEIILALTRGSPPWLRPQCLNLRAEHLAGRATLLPEAIRLQQEALSLCTGDSGELAPSMGRDLGRWLTLAGQPTEALQVLAAAEEAATQHEIPLEKLQIRVQALRAAAALGVDSAIMQEIFTAIRHTLAAMGSRLYEAEALLEAASFLPPTGGPLDPLPLVDEARRLFHDMPWPEKEARCHETAGDILRARSEEAQAGRRYQQARASCRRNGLALRLAILERRLEKEKPAPGS